MKVKFKLLKYLAYVIEILIFFAIEQTPNLLPKILNQKPILLIPILITIALFEKELTSLFFGIFTGILLDVGMWEIIGFYAIILGIIGYTVSHLTIKILKTNLVTALLVGFIAVWIIYTACFIFTFVLKGFDGSQYVFLNYYIVRIAYTFAFTPVFYFVNKYIKLNIKGKE